MLFSSKIYVNHIYYYLLVLGVKFDATQSMENIRLVGSTFATLYERSLSECALRCLENLACVSINMKTESEGRVICELNNEFDVNPGRSSFEVSATGFRHYVFDHRVYY